MCRKFTTFLLVLVYLSAIINVISCQKDQPEVVKKAWSGVLEAIDWVRLSMSFHESNHNESGYNSRLHLRALSDCARLYQDTQPRLAKLVFGMDYSRDDAVAWLSAAASSHRSCLDGLQEKGLAVKINLEGAYNNLTLLIEDALTFYGNRSTKSRGKGTCTMTFKFLHFKCNPIYNDTYRMGFLYSYIRFTKYIH